MGQKEHHALGAITTPERIAIDVVIDDLSIQVQMYALGISMTGEAVSKGSVAYLDDASLREVGVLRATWQMQERLSRNIFRA
jgi:hypothetical protein